MKIGSWLRAFVIALVAVPLACTLWTGGLPVRAASGPDHVSIRTNWLWYGC